MAKNKKGFILYADQKELFEQLPNDKAGELIKHIFSYVNDEEPTTDDLILKLAFTPIKQQLKRDLAKFEETKLKRSEAGKKSAEARRNKKEQESTKSTHVKSVEQTSTKSTVKENDKDKDNVKVKDKDINKDILAEFKNSLQPFLSDYSKDMLNDFYLYWTEKGEREKKYRWQKQKTWNLKRRLQRWSNNDFGSSKKIDPSKMTQKEIEKSVFKNVVF